jgi:hypothetical protein
MMYSVVRWADKDNPFSEITVYGPFENELKARQFANISGFGNYWRLAYFVHYTQEA